MNEGCDQEMFRSVFDALPSLLFIVDREVRIQSYNAAAESLLNGPEKSIVKQRAGEVLHCLHSLQVREGCGQGTACNTCTIRNVVRQAFQGNRSIRLRARLELAQGGKILEIYAMVSASPFRYQGRPLVLLVIEDISDIAELKQFLSICSICKKVRDEQECWHQIEAYFKNRWDVDFSHGLCPDCHEKEKAKLESYQQIGNSCC